MRPKHLLPILSLTKTILQTAVPSGGIAVDCTAGNGHDTLFLANLVGENGHVFAFDIQQTAIASTHERLTEANILNRATLFHSGHEKVHACIPQEHHGNIAVAMFNLGYLPGSDKSTITRADYTLMALNDLLPMLASHGLLSIHIYTGHPGGMDEARNVLDWAENLDWKYHRVSRYDFPNKQKNQEVLLLIEKLSNPALD